MEGLTPFMIACRGGFLDIAKFLVKKGIDVNVQDTYGNTSLMLATMNRTKNIALFLLNQKGIDVKAKDDLAKKSAIIYAASNGDQDIIDLLLQKGASMNTKDKSGKSAKEYLAEYNEKHNRQ